MAVRFETNSTTNNGEEWLILELKGDDARVEVALIVGRRKIREVNFFLYKPGMSFIERGQVNITADDVKYKFWNLKLLYTLRVEAVAMETEPLIERFEDKVMPYFDEIKDGKLTTEEAEKIYDGLTKELEHSLKDDLGFMWLLYKYDGDV